jgi:hypothetical protein
VAAEDYRELARGLICFLAMMKIEEDTRRGIPQGRQHLLDSITYDQVRELITRDPAIGSTIRTNCRARVETHFSPENAAQMALKVYEVASRISENRNAPI